MGKKRGIKHGSKRPVQRFKTIVEHKRMGRKRFTGNSEKGVLPEPLPKTALKILSVLAADGVAEQAMIAADCVKSNVSYWVRRFKEAGALVLRETQVPNSSGPVGKTPEYKPGHPHYYDLTSYGSKLLTLGDGRLYLPLLFEDRPLIFKVLQRESKAIPWKPMGNVRFWHKKGIMLAGVTVELHEGLGPNHDQANVMIHPGHIKGFNVDELMMDSARIVEQVKFFLEATYGLVLDAKGELPKRKDGKGPIRPRWRIYDPIIKEWMESGSVEIPGYGAADASPEPSKHGVRDPLSNEAHFEFENPSDAKIAASLFPSMTYDSNKQKLIDGLTAPAVIRETHQIVSCLVHRVEVLTVEVNKVKAVRAEVSGVMVEFRRLADSLSKLENLDSLPGISADLQRIVGVLGSLTNLEREGKSEGSAGAKDSGGKGYVS